MTCKWLTVEDCLWARKLTTMQQAQKTAPRLFMSGDHLVWGLVRTGKDKTCASLRDLYLLTLVCRAAQICQTLSGFAPQPKGIFFCDAFMSKNHVHYLGKSCSYIWPRSLSFYDSSHRVVSWILVFVSPGWMTESGSTALNPGITQYATRWGSWPCLNSCQSTSAFGFWSTAWQESL